MKTFTAFGVFGTNVITALTAQNTLGVRGVKEVEPSFVAAQLDAISADFALAATKTGMLARTEIIDTVAKHVRAHRMRNLVVDPVMVAASGDVLLAPDAVSAMRDLMLPLAVLVTPNVREAEILTGITIADITGMHAAARKLVEMGARAALVKGGRLGGASSTDVLCDGQVTREFNTPRVAIRRAHGTGCTLSAAIAACLALGATLDRAVESAKQYVTHALSTAERIAHGATPLNHLVKPEPLNIVSR